jgi:hypothetical protein
LVKIGLDFFTITVKKAGMKLSTYLAEKHLSPTEFGRRIGVSSESVRRYRDGGRIPERDVMARIVEATDSLVTPNDFYQMPGQ